MRGPFDPQNLDVPVAEFTGGGDLGAHSNEVVKRLNFIAKMVSKQNLPQGGGNGGAGVTTFVVVGLDVNGAPGTYESQGRSFELL